MLNLQRIILTITNNISIDKF